MERNKGRGQGVSRWGRWRGHWHCNTKSRPGRLPLARSREKQCRAGHQANTDAVKAMQASAEREGAEAA